MWKELEGGGFPNCLIAVVIAVQAHESHAGCFVWSVLPLPPKTISGYA